MYIIIAMDPTYLKPDNSVLFKSSIFKNRKHNNFVPYGLTIYVLSLITNTSNLAELNNFKYENIMFILPCNCDTSFQIRKKCSKQ